MRWLRFLGLSSRKPPARSAPGERWKPGEQAECIYAGPWYIGGTKAAPHGWGPELHEVRVVESVVSGIGYRPDEQMLGFARYRPKRFVATAFRKVTPRADTLEASEDGYVDLFAPAPKLPAAPSRVKEVATTARLVVVHLVLPATGICVFFYAVALTAWAVTGSGAAV